MSLDLVIDTAVFALTIGLFEHGQLKWQVHNETHLGHQESLGPLIYQGLEETQSNLDDLKSVGVTVGPGSFTGLRMGMGFAQGLVQGQKQKGQNCDLIGINVLDALVSDPKLDGQNGPILALMDAGRGRFVARSRHGDRFSSLWRGETATLMNDPSLLADYQAIIATPFRDLDLVTDLKAIMCQGPSAQSLYRIRQSSQAMTEIRPIYLREADATVSQKPKITIS